VYLQAKKVVLCAGAWTNEVLRKMGLEEMALEVRRGAKGGFSCAQ